MDKVKSMVNALKKLARLGQSPWLDNIDRRLIKNGKLKELFDNGILGVTSNPTIFQKAVDASSIYDESIKELSGRGKKSREIYDILTTEDIALAAGLLTNTYEKSNHLDGYVSIEVLPEFAHNVEETVRYARSIFRSINLPNIMIKVPGTKEGARAVRRLIKEGINVNVTLLFSVKHYEAGALAYIEGLKDRLSEGKEIGNIFSVASVFVSRIDTRVDKILQAMHNKELQGTSAVANSKMIYRKFKELFESGSFQELSSKGANIQRPLWASTSTKNPAYSDVKYVEELIAPETVNTMPPETVNAFLDHGEARPPAGENRDKSESLLAGLKSLGIDMGDVCQGIQDDGVKSFQDSFDKLIQSIEQKLHS